MPLLIKTEITEEAYHTFLKISVHLTGFGQNELLATGMHETYYYTIMKETDQDNVRSFFIKAQEILDKNSNNESQLKKDIKEILIPSTAFMDLAKRIILLWYTGIWTTKNAVVGKNGRMFMVSAEAYQQSLIWVAAETHPAGAKQTGFDSWAYPPL